MKVLFVSYSILLMSFVGVSLSLPYTNKPEEFDIHIFEKGLNYEQHVELDEADEVVTVYVPGHNDIDETYFITDLQTHLTMKVVPEQDVCLLMRNDPEELPPVDVWKKTREFTKCDSNREGRGNWVKAVEGLTDMKEIVQQNSYVMTEAVTEREWATVPRKMREICGKRTAVWTEVVSGEHEQHEKGKEFIVHRNSTGEDDSTRFKRDLRMAHSYSGIFYDDCRGNNITRRCVVRQNSCYRVIYCPEEVPDSDCARSNHITGSVLCCQNCCLTDVQDMNPTRPCSEPTTPELLCSRIVIAFEEA